MENVSLDTCFSSMSSGLLSACTLNIASYTMLDGGARKMARNSTFNFGIGGFNMKKERQFTGDDLQSKAGSVAGI